MRHLLFRRVRLLFVRSKSKVVVVSGMVMYVILSFFFLLLDKEIQFCGFGIKLKYEIKQEFSH